MTVFTVDKKMAVYKQASSSWSWRFLASGVIMFVLSTTSSYGAPSVRKEHNSQGKLVYPLTFDPFMLFLSVTLD